MKTKIYMICGLMVVLSVVGIGNTFENTFNTDLMAGQHFDSGEVRVWNDNNSMYISYQTDGDWCLNSAKMDVERKFEEIPQTKKGNPKPGKFDYKAKSKECMDNYTFKVDLNEKELVPGECVSIAAHAEVFNKDTGRKETAWANGTEFPWKNWAMYFDYCLENKTDDNQTNGSENKIWELPTEKRIFIDVLNKPGLDGNFLDIELSDFQDENYDLKNGTHGAWCVDSNTRINSGEQYYADVYSSYSQNIPSYLSDDEKWDMIKYIINQNYNATWKEKQAAIWYFSDQNPDYHGYWTNKSQEIVEDAETHGENFYPSTREYGAVILDVDDGQSMFVRVDP